MPDGDLDFSFLDSSVKAIIITDSAGNQYIVDKNGKVSKGTAGAGSGTSSVNAAQLDDFEKKILEILNEYLKEIKDYKSTQQQKNPSKGGGPSLTDWEWEEIILAGLPSCFESYKNRLTDIENKIIDHISSTDKLKAFVRSIKGNVASTSNDGQVRDAICKALTEGLGTQIPTNLKITLAYDKNPVTYLPIKNDSIRATVSVNSLADSCEVKFILVKADDVTFGDNTKTPKLMPLNGNSITATLLSKSYGSVVTMRAVLIRNGHKLDSAQLQLPIDTDGDQIADIWELDAVNGGTLALGRNNQKDRDWNEDKSRGNNNDGDGYSKWEEYQGIVINNVHQRLKPTRKEVFFDITRAAEGAFVMQEFQSQLDVNTINTGPPTGTPFAIGTTKIAIPLTIADMTFKAVHNDGIYYTLGVAAGHGTDLLFGETTGPFGAGGTPVPYSRIYAQTIRNVWTNNSIPESATVTRKFDIQTTGGFVSYYAVYDGTDLNGDGDSTDMINHFDLLAPQRGAFRSNSKADNDPIDGLIATISQQQKHRNTSLHEAGHAVGIVSSNTAHPLTGNSVMRSGIGPAQVPQFSAQEIRQMILK